MSKLTHLNPSGEAHMVDVSAKADTLRTAIAQSQVELTAAIVAAITDDNLPKGDLYATARIAGIQAAKKCSDLIPLCHPLPLSKITVDIELQGNCLLITALCKTRGKTGVEMEAVQVVPRIRRCHCKRRRCLRRSQSVGRDAIAKGLQ